MPRDLSSVRLVRLNDLLRILGSAPCVPRQRLLHELGGYTSRTLERDLDYLRSQFGTKVSWDFRRKGYVLHDPGAFMMHLSLSEREAIALVAGLGMACHFLPHLEGTCGDLWGKLRGALPEGLAGEAERLAQGTVVALPVSTLNAAFFETILDAIRRHRIIRARYTSPYAPVPEERPVTLSPWGVFFRAHAWYLWSWSHGSEAERTYRISRFAALDVTEEPALAPPEGRSVTGFAKSAWYGFSGGELFDVALRISPPLSRVVTETRWHETQIIEVCDDGSIILRARVPDLDDVARWALASAPSAVVLAPEELRDRVEKLARSMLEKYAEGGKEA